MRQVAKRRCLLGATLAVCGLVPAWAAGVQPQEDGWLERLHADRVRAADRTLAEAGIAGVSQAFRANLLPHKAEPTANPAPRWQRKLPPEVRRLLRHSFAAEGVPVELLSVAWVESRFNPRAMSAKGARGVWQLMPATARRYGLTVNSERDDRVDWAHATRAATRHLADLHRRFGDWLVALAAYNAGVPRVEAAMAQAGSRNFWRFRPWLPPETRKYVPAVLAAMGRWAASASDAGDVSGAASPLAAKNLFATTKQGSADVDKPRAAERHLKQ